MIYIFDLLYYMNPTDFNAHHRHARLARVRVIVRVVHDQKRVAARGATVHGVGPLPDAVEAELVLALDDHLRCEVAEKQRFSLPVWPDVNVGLLAHVLVLLELRRSAAACQRRGTRARDDGPSTRIARGDARSPHSSTAATGAVLPRRR